MTFCFAAKCKDGVIVAGDRRVTSNDVVLDCEQTKVAKVNEQTIVAFAGNRTMGRSFIDQMVEWSATGNKQFRETIEKVETILESIWDKYGKVTGDNEIDKYRAENDAKLQTIVVGLDFNNRGKAKIYSVDTLLVPDEEDSLRMIGSGSNVATGLIELLLNKDLTIEEAWPLALLIIKIVSLRHFSVGGTPDIYLVKDNDRITKIQDSEVKILYYGERIDKLLKELPGYVLSQLS